MQLAICYNAFKQGQNRSLIGVKEKPLAMLVDVYFDKDDHLSRYANYKVAIFFYT